MKSAKTGRSGFTLLELLLAVAVLGLILIVLSNGISLVTHRLNRSGEKLDRSALVALVQNYLRAAFSDAIPVSVVEDGTGALDFEGSSDAVVFVTRAPISSPSGGLLKLNLRSRKDRYSGAVALVVDWQAYPSAIPGDATIAGTKELLSALRKVEFAYFDPGGPDQPAGWRTGWREMPNLPGLIKLAVTFGDGSTPPDLVVALRLANSAAPMLPSPAPGKP